MSKIAACTEVRFASFVSGGFIIAIVVNPPERNLAKRTSVACPNFPFAMSLSKFGVKLLSEIDVRDQSLICKKMAVFELLNDQLLSGSKISLISYPFLDHKKS